MRPRDLLLVRQAIREGWDPPQAVREQVVKRILEFFDDPEAKPRWQIAGISCVIKMAADNQRQQFAAIDVLRRLT